MFKRFLRHFANRPVLQAVWYGLSMLAFGAIYTKLGRSDGLAALLLVLLVPVLLAPFIVERILHVHDQRRFENPLNEDDPATQARKDGLL